MRRRPLLAAFLRDRFGGLTQIFALAVPAVMVLGVGAVDLASVSADRLLVQDATDSAALAAAKELALSDPRGVRERAEAFVDGKLDVTSDRMTYDVTVKPADDGSSVTVVVKGVRKSFFANMLPPGGWKINSSATAAVVSRIPLCVLSTGDAKISNLDMDDAAKISAGGCLVHANADITVKKQAVLSAAMIQSSGKTTGTVAPQAQTGAPEIGDPFTETAFKAPAHCDVNLSLLLSGTGLVELGPGSYCADIRVLKNQKLKLKPGIYYFKKGSKLELLEQSKLEGTDVLLVFDKGSDFKFKDNSVISLEGRKTGTYAGFVLATTRGNTEEFEISSSAARKLLGTIYIPDAVLRVEGKDKVADQSAWTVVVARGIKMKGSPSLVINSNYAGTTVAPPKGVGPSATEVRLTN
ncbi:MAG: pilus assembly protein TadG-related protein [Phenylobacterium sp.]